MKGEYVPTKQALWWLEQIADHNGVFDVVRSYKGLPLGWALHSLLNNGYVDVIRVQPTYTTYKLTKRGYEYVLKHETVPEQEALF